MPKGHWIVDKYMEVSDFTPEEEQRIEQEFQALLDDYAHTTHRQKVELITRAYHFAKQAHNGVRRLSGEPYIMHPLAVARIVVKDIGLGSTSICSALLDVVLYGRFRAACSATKPKNRRKMCGNCC